jgi:hypothetical protein
MYVVNQLKLQSFQPCSINLTTTKKQGLFAITSSDINFVKHAETKGGVHLLLPGTDRCFWVPLHQKLRLNERQITIKCEKDLATFSLIPNADFDNFLNSFGTMIDGTEFGYYKNDEKLSLDFKTGIRNGTRNAIIRLEQHLPFKSKISFCEERISFAISYRDIEIKKVSPKTMLRETIGPQPFSPNLELLKAIVTYGNPICLSHLPFLPAGSTESGTIPLPQNDGSKRSQNMEMPANQGPLVQVTYSPGPKTPTIPSPPTDGFPGSTNQRPPVHLGKWETTSSHVISSKGQNQNISETRSNLASEIEVENIVEEIENMDFDHEEIEAT